MIKKITVLHIIKDFVNRNRNNYAGNNNKPKQT